MGELQEKSHLKRWGLLEDSKKKKKKKILRGEGCLKRSRGIFRGGAGTNKNL